MSGPVVTVELRQLRAFVEVADTGHFGRAAERLNLTQPALTQRIQALERELGVSLLERSAREVKLTAGGVILLPRARALLDTEEHALLHMKDHSAGVAGRVRLAYQSSGDVWLAGAIIAEYRRRYPVVELETTSASSGPNLQRLIDHQADAAFALMTSDRPPGLSTVTIRREEIILALRSDHRLARMDRIPVHALRGEPLGLPPETVNPDLMGALRRWLERRTGGKLNVVSNDPTDLAIETLAKSGVAATVAVRRYMDALPESGVALRSLSPAPMVELVVAYHSDDPSAALANLLRVVREVAPFDAGDMPEDGELI